MSEERFYVLEHAGWSRPSVSRAGGVMPTEVMILDRFYCHRVVWSRWSGGTSAKQGIFGHGELADVRREADRVCGFLNRQERMETAA